MVFGAPWRFSTVTVYVHMYINCSGHLAVSLGCAFLACAGGGSRTRSSTLEGSRHTGRPRPLFTLATSQRYHRATLGRSPSLQWLDLHIRANRHSPPQTTPSYRQRQVESIRLHSRSFLFQAAYRSVNPCIDA